MKKFFTIIAIASMMLTTTFGFTSCKKDDPLTEQTAKQNVANAKKNAKHKEYKANHYSVTITNVTPSQLKK